MDTLASIWHYMGVLAAAAPLTIGLTFGVMAVAVILALPVALARLDRSPRYLKVIATIYVEFFRGTPLLLQVYYAFFVLPLVGVKMSPILAGVIAFGLNYAAYLSEVYRSSIAAVNTGQREAGLAMGLSERRIMFKIILPQAARVAAAPMGNYFVALFKDTALLSTIGVVEILFRSQLTASTTYQYFDIYTAAMVIYLIISYPTSIVLRKLEQRLAAQSGILTNA